MPSTLRDQRIKEVLTISSLFLFISALTPYLMRLLVGAWEREGAVYNLVWGIARELGSTDVIFILPTAIYVALLILVLLDRMKIVQGMLLAAASVIGGVLLYRDSLLWGNVDWIGNLHIVLIGLMTGLALGGGRKLYDKNPPFEFRRAIQMIFVLISMILVVALLETHIIYENPIGSANGLVVRPFDPSTLGFEAAGFVTNTVLAGAFIVMLQIFTNYEYSQSFMVVGPKRGGKTTLMTGVYHTANEITEETVEANDVLIEHRSELIENTPGFGDVDKATQAGKEDYLWFKYDHGQLLRKRVEVEAVDHGGEVLADIQDDIRKLQEEKFPWNIIRKRPTLTRLVEILGISLPSTSLKHELVSTSIYDSDSLIITIPLHDFVVGNVDPSRIPKYFDDPAKMPKYPDKSKYMAEFKKILNQIERNGDDKEILVVTTMTDLVIEEFKHQKGRSNQPLTSDQDFLELEQWITHEVLNSYSDLLLNYSKHDQVLSVHFEMNQNQHAGKNNDEPNPVLRNGEVNFVGGERFLRELGE